MSSFDKIYLSEALSEIDELYTEEAFEMWCKSEDKKKNTHKKIIVLVATMIAVRGLTKYVSQGNVKFLKRV